MKEKTLEDFKRSFAIEKNLKNWSDILFMAINNMISAQEFGRYCDEVAENYANHVKAIALQEGRNEGFKKGCELQKKACTEHALLYISHEFHDNEVKKEHTNGFCGYTITPDKDSILNAPDAVNPFKT